MTETNVKKAPVTMAGSICEESGHGQFAAPPYLVFHVLLFWLGSQPAVLYNHFYSCIPVYSSSKCFEV